MQVKKQHELDTEKWTGSKLGKVYDKTIYCHPAYLTYMQNTSWEMGWMKHKLESRLLGDISITSDMQIDAFELWCWKRLLSVPWTARRSNQSVLKEISPEYSLGGLMLKLKLQYFGHLMRRTDSLEETLMLGKIEGGRRRG